MCNGEEDGLQATFGAPVGHKSPVQHGKPAEPHEMQRLDVDVLQIVFVAVHAVPVAQQAAPTMLPQAEQPQVTLEARGATQVVPSGLTVGASVDGGQVPDGQLIGLAAVPHGVHLFVVLQ